MPTVNTYNSFEFYNSPTIYNIAGATKLTFESRSTTKLVHNTSGSLYVLVMSSSDHFTPYAGSSLTLRISKGGVFSSVSRTITLLENGIYKVDLTSADTNVIGEIAILLEGSDADTSFVTATVVAAEVPIDNAAIAAAVRTELTPELAHIMTLQNGLTSTQATMLLELYRVYGLDPTKPLIVTNTSRTVTGAGINQIINSDSSSTTVTRV